MKKICFITTVNHNVGDDFVREGIIYLFKQKFKNTTLNFELIHKHSPITTRHGFEWFRNYRFSKYVDQFLPLSITKDKVLEADILVQSGAPVYWCHPEIGGPHCYANEWFEPLIKRRYLERNFKIPFLNLAAGTCQRYDSDGGGFNSCKFCQDYIKELQGLTKVTTVRDKLAKKVLNNMGINAPVIPCSSIFACELHGVNPKNPEYVALNYMSGGAHYVFGQKIEFEKWENNFKRFYKTISRFEKCIFVCHNQDEVMNAKKIDSNANIFISHDYKDYIKFYSKAKFGIMNRVHGAFLIASFGRPAVLIGNDSRVKMSEEITLSHTFVNNADLNWLLEQYEYLKNGGDNYSQKFNGIKKKAYNDYQEALSVL
ncbi:MAG: polysaccharide pyruvyl transferase family protein [Calditrichales bacterium]|nr:polysaccharide pyruvyl transferase family protein [Calditrichales bacterium]